MDIKLYIEKLLLYAINNDLMTADDYNFVRNQLMDLLNVDEVCNQQVVYDPNEHIDSILQPIIEYALKNNLIADEALTLIDAFSARIMGLLIGRPSEIIDRFNSIKKAKGIVAATDWFYSFSQKTNYIQTGRIAKNISWSSTVDKGTVDITINLSKPEKDPRDIALALKQKPSSYPKCILCPENEGFRGNMNLPARQNHRIIPLDLVGEKWFFQYSPYVYFNEHSILLSEEHRPMKIDRLTFERLLRFLEKFPHYFIGSNADLPIVGGSILSHDHFQAGRCTFPMTNASIVRTFTSSYYKELEIQIVDWYMSTIRLVGSDILSIVDLADKILHSWRNYSNEKLQIVAFTEQTPHNTITPIARFRNNRYELDLVLRNNRTTPQYPDGIFHPHQHLHHIKKENIGLIEVMGLAILPGRLLNELFLIEKHLFETISIDNLCMQYPELQKHSLWIENLRYKYTNNRPTDIAAMLRDEVALKFVDVLRCCAVFKEDEISQLAFFDFVQNSIE